MFDNSEYFLNRELSWLKFNGRVLQESGIKTTPVGERLKFIAITSSNLDEFYMIRVAGLRHQLDSNIHKLDVSGLTVAEQLAAISHDSHVLVQLQYRYLKNILRQLATQKIEFVQIEELARDAKEWCHNYFRNTIYPVITPVAVDASHPFPVL